MRWLYRNELRVGEEGFKKQIFCPNGVEEPLERKIPNGSSHQIIFMDFVPFF
jgi:hypothetical protein